MMDADKLRALEQFALRGGAPVQLVGELMDELVAMALDVQEMRRALGPSRLNALQDRHRLRQFVKRYERSGYARPDIAAAARAQLGFSKSKFYRLWPAAVRVSTA